MPIKIPCPQCGNTIQAPDDAGGKRGRCPHCQHGLYIPLPAEQAGELDLAPLDEQEEQRLQQEQRRLREIERKIFEENVGRGDGAPPAVPLEQREDLSSGDLDHFVVNFCLDMAAGNLERAQLHARNLGRHGPLGRAAVEDFLKDEPDEPALKHIPKPVRKGFLKQLLEELSA
jgi:hypothetical protein